MLLAPFMAFMIMIMNAEAAFVRTVMAYLAALVSLHYLNEVHNPRD